MTGIRRVAVVGMGKIGLPLAAQFAARGARVIGCDVDEGVVGAINQGACPIQGEPGLAEAISSARAAGRLSATTDTAKAVFESEVIVCIVPVAIDDERRPDFRHLDAAAAAISGGLRAGSLVVLETTVPVGVTRGRFARDLVMGSGLLEADLHVAYSPERVSSGQVLRDLASYPKVIGGVTPDAGEKAAAFYRSVLDAEVMVVPDAETAEFAKLAESVYRDVNIALANELAQAADRLGVDYATAAAAANSQPYSHLHTPGVGVGGHCIPVYPYFLLDGVAGQDLISTGREVNDGMAEYAVQRLDAAFHKIDGSGIAGKSVLILGVAYRGNVKEAAFSSTLLLVEALRRHGARPLVHDPLFGAAEIRGLGLEPSGLPPENAVDASVLQAAHREYVDLDLALLKGCKVFLDGRGVFDRKRVEAAGLTFVGVGSGGR